MKPENRRGLIAASHYVVLGFVGLFAIAVLIVALRYSANRQNSNSPKVSDGGAQAGLSATNTNAAASTNALSESELDRLIRTMNDGSLTLAERRKAIFALAHDGSPAALAALKDALARYPNEIRKTIAEALGECPTRGGLALLIDLLKDSDAAVAKAAVRGLARQNQAGAATALSQFLNDTNSASGVRCEAALALGELKQPWVLDPLSRIARHDSDEDVAKAALDGIGNLDFNDTKAFFQDYINSPDVSTELRSDAIDALAAGSGDSAGFLAQIAGNKDLDADLRAEAAWAMSTTGVTGDLSTQLLAMLQNEDDPDVRLRLYQALNNQDSYDSAAVLALVQKETDPAAITAGLESLAKAFAANPNDPQLQSYFAQSGIDQLKNIILGTSDLDTRQKAIIALSALAAAHDQPAVDALNSVRDQINQQQLQQQQARQQQAQQKQAQYDASHSGPRSRNGRTQSGSP